tara:strand:+ start:490 stop:1824 length:1335 start_codon:yes stop_codon:yes gene_type:complete
MASTYVNDLRLEEIGTGEASGTWGTKTNVNLELIGEAFSYGSEAIANASTHTITLADGTSDQARSFYLKCTGGGQACTVTLAPNTVSKVWMIENATSATLTFSQGSGANVAVAAGEVKMIATDGQGSAAVVYDLLTDANLAGTTAVAALKLAGTTVTSTGAELNILDGVTATAAELNILDGVTSTAAELNILDGVTSTTAELNILDGVTSTTAELNILDGVTSTAAELNILDGVTSTTAELNILDGVTATTTELNFVDGVTSSIQTQINLAVAQTPAGAIMPFAMSSVPTGWLECNGSAVSRSTYASLFSAISDDYGAGDGSSTFNLPDLRGTFIRGFANGSSNDADRASRTNRGDGTTGDVVGSKQADAIRNIVGEYKNVASPFPQGDAAATGAFFLGSSGAGQTGITGSSGTPNLKFDASRNVATGSDNRPLNVQMMYCIKT